MVSYPEILAGLFNAKYGIAVAGTHGKTTTSAWLANTLKEVGTDPVAMDSVVFDHVTESLPEKVKDFPPPNMLLDAAKGVESGGGGALTPAAYHRRLGQLVAVLVLGLGGHHAVRRKKGK